MGSRIRHSDGDSDKQSQSGSRARATIRCLLTIFLGGLAPLAHGAENEATGNIDMPLPDLEFLEFLGQFETDDGEWIDPGSLLSEEFEDLLNAAENSNPTNDDDNDTNDQ